MYSVEWLLLVSICLILFLAIVEESERMLRESLGSRGRIQATWGSWDIT